MSDVQIVTGDDVIILNDLVKDKEPISVPNSATVTCKIVSLDQSVDYCEEVIQSDSEDGADWINGVIAVSLPADITQQIADNETIDWKKGSILAKLLTRVDDNGRSTFLGVITISRG